MIQALSAFLERVQNKSSNNDAVADKHALHRCCFALMAIIARADNDFSEAERHSIIEIGSTLYGLNDIESSEIVAQASQDAVDSTSLYEFTSSVQTHMDESDKFQLIKALWRIAFADGTLDKFEEHIIRRIADLIYLDHARFIEAKLSAQQEQ